MFCRDEVSRGGRIEYDRLDVRCSIRDKVASIDGRGTLRIVRSNGWSRGPCVISLARQPLPIDQIFCRVGQI